MKKPRLKHLRIISSTCYAHIPVKKRKKMDKKAVKGYLVGYDGDERYRIWLIEENRVILSRDVIFQEKPSRCIQLMLKEPSNEGKHAEEKLDENERQLRDCSVLRTPARFEDYIMEAESFVYESDNPGTFGESINSKESATWKKATESKMASHSENQMWELPELTAGSKALPCRGRDGFSE
ncbi:hypothetical protein AVEN_208020-1 [Araneus ventricosus]|uniref:Retroviral polymerase SH3-like domain-containing protein n=1 Tax=Araneus ventricosus TaxID=182803 RepID=A0A4Y2F001_ARAVE|nr:hypothetical protein AVEN_208020-1 [Araneus ventricosus]